MSIDEPYEQTLPLGTDGGEPQSRPIGVGIYHDNANFTVTDGRLTVDVSELTGVAEVTWPGNCTPSGTRAVCDVPVVPVIDGDYEKQVLLTVRAADGAAVGAQGRITYEATATGGPDGTLTAPHESSETTLTVGTGPDLTIDPIADIERGQPGDERTIPLKITNNGNESANGFTIQLYASYGLTDPTRYDACTYTVTDGNDYPPSTMAICTFDQVLAPGDSFELPEPLTVRLAPRALNERLDIDVEPGDGAQDINSANDYVALQIGAENTADFSVTGDSISGAAGETATAELTFKNNGPAWFAHLGSGDPVAEVRLIVPEGTQVTGVPSGCHPRTLAAWLLPEADGRPALRLRPAVLGARGHAAHVRVLRARRCRGARCDRCREHPSLVRRVRPAPLRLRPGPHEQHGGPDRQLTGPGVRSSHSSGCSEPAPSAFQRIGSGFRPTLQFDPLRFGEAVQAMSAAISSDDT